MSQPKSVVIVGGGMAGANAAFTLRKLGYDGRVALVSAEAELPYERPPLSKDYLRGESSIEKAYVRPAPDYGDERIELLAGTTATAIDTADHRVDLDDGRSLNYGALVLATGSEPRRPAGTCSRTRSLSHRTIPIPILPFAPLAARNGTAIRWIARGCWTSSPRAIL